MKTIKCKLTVYFAEPFYETLANISRLYVQLE